MIQLKLEGLVDSSSEENFRDLNNFFAGFLGLFQNFRVYTVTLNGAVTDKPLYHRLGFVPQDVIVTKNSTGATVSFSPSLFTSEYLTITTSGACELNLLIGKFPNRTQL